MKTVKDQRLFETGGFLMGIGLGGFFDGILFHQILQLHAMFTGRIPNTTLTNIEINMFWDGIFHAVTWVATVAGFFLLWTAVCRMQKTHLSSRILIGSLFLGWGVFNFIEGIIDHQILHLHHVVERLGVSIWDYTFLTSGIVFAVLGKKAIAIGRTETWTAERDIQRGSFFK
jgi:uncharacterized membrane protein